MFSTALHLLVYSLAGNRNFARKNYIWQPLPYPGPRGFSWYFTAWDSERAAKWRTRVAKRREEKNPLVPSDLNLTSSQLRLIRWKIRKTSRTRVPLPPMLFSSPEAALLLVSTKNRDLWLRPTTFRFECLCRHSRLRPELIRFVRLNSEHAQSDGKSVNRGLPVLDLARGR